MGQVITALIAMTCIAFVADGAVQAQLPKTASVGFQNRSDVNVIVVGYTIVNGSTRKGPALQLKKGGGKAFESNVPIGVARTFTIHDANQPTIILGRHQIPALTGDVIFDVVPSPNNPKILMLVQPKTP